MTKALDLSDFSKEEIIETLSEIRHPFDVAVYSCENYFNLGTIIRTAHNNLCSTIYGVDITKFYGKACMSAKKYEKINKLSLDEFILKFKQRNIVSLERRTGLQTENLSTFIWPENPIMFFGSPKFGVPDSILEISNNVVSIPVYGLLHDYNVASAAAVAMYDWTTKYYKNG